MRRAVGLVLVGLGTFLVVLAPLFHFYVAPHAAVAPLTCSSGPLCDRGVLLSPSSGVATTLFDAGSLKVLTNVPVSSQRRVKGDVSASTGANDRTVYDESLTTVRSQDQSLVDSTTARIAFDGHSSQMIDCCHSNTDGTPIKDFSGIMPWKFPFDTQKKTYQYFDTVLAKALPMKYVSTQTVDGVQTYKFVQVIPPTQFATLEVPGSLVGSTQPSVTAPRFYANVRTVWVEPVTGVIVDGREQIKQTLRDASGADKLVLIDVDLRFTAGNVKESAHLASQGKNKLTLVSTTVPLICLVLGIISLVIGLVLLLRRSGEAGPAEPSPPVPAATA